MRISHATSSAAHQRLSLSMLRAHGLRHKPLTHVRGGSGRCGSLRARWRTGGKMRGGSRLGIIAVERVWCKIYLRARCGQTVMRPILFPDRRTGEEEWGPSRIVFSHLVPDQRSMRARHRTPRPKSRSGSLVTRWASLLGPGRRGGDQAGCHMSPKSVYKIYYAVLH